jgi:Reverse transcriptase (RNA-dependent DNA polymerase)
MNNTQAISLAIKNVQKEGLTDIFPRPEEVDLLHDQSFVDEISKQVETRLKSNTLLGLKIHPIQHVLFPKKTPFDFRRAALIQPMDTITFSAVVLTIADEIEKHRPPASKNYVFSYRFKPMDGIIFDEKYNFASFDEHVKKRITSRKVKVLVKCDIASFYDRLNLHRLESNLLGISIDKGKVALINNLLLFWANRDSYGLPIGCNASRILAETSLISVDDYLISHQVSFCRFVDDYRFFAPNMKIAHAWLTLFVERLCLEGLFINSAKTFIEDVSDKTNKSTPLIVNTVQANHGNSLNVKDKNIIYYESVPTRFRELTEKEGNDLRKEDLNKIIDDIQSKILITPNDVISLLKILVAQEAFEKLVILPDILDRFPQFTSMVVDLLIKKMIEIPEKIRSQLRDYFVEKLNTSEYLSEYLLIAIVDILSSKGYESKTTLLNLFRNLKRNAGAFIGRHIIDSLYGLATRNDALEIRQYFPRADMWERRAIIRLVHRYLAEEEKRPWLKNIKIHMEDDPFAIALINRKSIV